MFEEKMTAERARFDNSSMENGMLSNEVSILTDKLDKREQQLRLLKNSHKQLQAQKAKADAELVNLRERLTVAQELENIDLGQFNSMRQTNLEVAKKIENFYQVIEEKINRPAAAAVAASDSGSDS